MTCFCSTCKSQRSVLRSKMSETDSQVEPLCWTTQEEKKDAAATLDTDHWFPPRPLCDFVVHYEGHSFFVHKVKLHERSKYFRTYFETLPSPHKRQRREEESEPRGCSHDRSISCMELPGIERRFCLGRSADRPLVIAVDGFLAFLYALYFPSSEPYFPFKMKVKPTLEEQPDDIDATQVYPELKCGFRGLLRSGVGGAYLQTHWLDLAVYLGCSTLLARADTVIHGGQVATVTSEAAMSDVHVCVFYGLQTAQEKVIGVVLKDHLYQSRRSWKEYEKYADLKIYQALFAGAMAKLHPGASR